VGLLGNAAEVFPELVRRMKAGGPRPDIVTDQTSAHDPLHGYLPVGWTVADWRAKQESDPKAVEGRRAGVDADPCRRDGRFLERGRPHARLRQQHPAGGEGGGAGERLRLPGLRAGLYPPALLPGIGPFRWVALSGDPEDIRKTDAAMKRLFPENTHLHRWLDMASERIAFQGLPARICWIGLGDRHRAGLMFNEMVALGRAEGPDRHRARPPRRRLGRLPNRETEAMRDGSDAVSDWPLLNALVNTASGATWVSLHHGGGVGMGFSQHAGVVIVADGTPEAAKRLERVLWNDPASGVWRHADAGYEEAIACAREHGLRLPRCPASLSPTDRTRRPPARPARERDATAELPRLAGTGRPSGRALGGEQEARLARAHPLELADAREDGVQRLERVGADLDDQVPAARGRMDRPHFRQPLKLARDARGAAALDPDHHEAPHRHDRGVGPGDDREAKDVAVPAEAVHPGAHRRPRQTEPERELRQRHPRVMPQHGDEPFVRFVHSTCPI
jgi:hypothetical protein